MLHDQATNAVLAIALGSVLAVLLFIPVAAAQYRIDGRLGPGDLATLVLGAIYALAIWTYTLLPFPTRGDVRCQQPRLDPLTSFELVHWPGAGGLTALLREPAFLQIVLNLLLFVPLGWFVRVILHRGVVVATLLGLAVSLLVETTQGTGVWHVYPCAYRLFDVDDLIVNTLGATVGALLSHLVVRRRRPDVVLPTTITLGRRIAGLLSDALFIVLTGVVAALVWRAVQGYGLHGRDVDVEPAGQQLAQWLLPLLVEAVAVVGFGRTVGELVVSLHTRPRRPALLVGSRAVKLVTGVGPVFVLVLLPPVWALLGLVAYAVATVACIVGTSDRRGLSHVLAHLELRIGDDGDA